MSIKNTAIARYENHVWPNLAWREQSRAELFMNYRGLSGQMLLEDELLEVKRREDEFSEGRTPVGWPPEGPPQGSPASAFSFLIANLAKAAHTSGNPIGILPLD